MGRRSSVGTLALACCAVVVLCPASPGHAGLTDALKKKSADQAAKAAQAAAGSVAPGAKPAAAESGAPTPAEPPASAGSASSAPAAKVSSISTKFDYVPGDSVMLYDDFTQDELGEFPVKWRLVEGNLEVADMDGERWLRCTSAEGRIRMKVPSLKSLPEFWTLEFDFYATEPMGSALTMSGMRSDDRPAWEATWPHGVDLSFSSGTITSRTPLEGVTTPAGRHHVMFMARDNALKVYMDRQRLVNVPEIAAAAPGPPNEIEFRLLASTHPMITKVRFAEGCRPAKDMLAEGKLVTYGILFATGSDVVLPESAPVLRQIAAYLEANASVRLLITGHTDNVGSPAANLELSKRRAASVARVLTEQFAISADHFETEGKGDTKPVASNAKPEGRAMNRRVEFSKIQPGP